MREINTRIAAVMLSAVLVLSIIAGCGNKENRLPFYTYRAEVLELPAGVLANQVKLMEDGLVLINYNGSVVFADYHGNIQNEVDFSFSETELLYSLDVDEENGNTYVQTSEAVYTIDKDGNLTSEPSGGAATQTTGISNDKLGALRAAIVLADYGENEDELLDVRLMSNNDIICAFRNERFMVRDIIRYVYVDPDEISPLPPVEKQIITLYALEIEGWLNAYIAEFNKISSAYRIETKTFLAGDIDHDAALRKLNTELIAGSTPDIIIYDYRMSVRSHIDKGLLADIYEIMASDPDFCVDDYLQNAFAASERNGGLYTIFPSFSIYTITAKTDDAGDSMGWTLDEFAAFIDTNPDANYILWLFTKEGFLTEMIYKLFIDTETGDISFDRMQFMKLLEIAERFPDDIGTVTNLADFNAGAATGDPLVLFDIVTDFRSIRITQAYFGESFTYKGWPETGGNGAYFGVDARFAITSTAGNKDGAWEFIKYMLDNYNDPYFRRLPVRLSDLERLAEEAKAGEISVVVAGGRNVNLPANTNTENAAVMELITSTNQVLLYDWTITAIIEEEIGSYLKGQTTATQAADIIENKISIYLSESS